MKVRIKTTAKNEVDAIQGLKARAGKCIERHLSAKLRSQIEEDYPNSKPLNLWEAKLCLEIVKLLIETGEGA